MTEREGDDKPPGSCGQGRSLIKSFLRPVGWRRNTVHWAFRILVLAIVGGGVFGIVIAEVLLRFPRSASGARPENYSLAWENVEIRSPDGTVLRGWWIPSQHAQGTVLVLHGHGADKGDALPFARFLHHAGFAALLMDLRGHGESGGRTGSLGFHEARDIAAAVDWLFETAKVPDGKLGVLGYSMGAGIGILAAAGDGRVRALVSDSAFADGRETLTRWLQYQLPLPRFPVIMAAAKWAEWRLGCDYSAVSPARRIRALAPRPVLLIHGELDRLIPAEDSRRLYEAAAQPKELWIVPGAGHVGSYDQTGAAYEERVTAFFERALAGPNPLTPRSGG